MGWLKNVQKQTAMAPKGWLRPFFDAFCYQIQEELWTCLQVLEYFRYVNVIAPSRGNDKTKVEFYNAWVMSSISINHKINVEFFLILSVCLQWKG